MTNPQGNPKNWTGIIGYILVSTPILVYWLYWTFNPSYWFNGDPAAFYFLDSLSVFAGGTYVYVDHPGTPMQVMGTIMLALTYPFLGGKESFINFYITQPEAFFLMAHIFLLAMNILTAVILYKTAYSTLSHDRIFGAIALAILFFTLHPYSFQSLTLWSHNSLNFPFGTLLLLWLYRELRKEGEIRKNRLVFLGFAAGLLAVAQVYFFAWVATCVFTIFVYTLRSNHTLKQAVFSGLLTLFGSLLGITSMLLPIYKEIPRFLNWFTSVAATEGIYGTGKRGFFSLAMISTALDYWWTSLRSIMLVLLLTLIALGILAWLKRKSSARISPGAYAMLAGLTLHTGLILLMLVKTVGKLRYSLSLAAILPILILLVLKLSETTFWGRLKLSRAVYAAIIIGVTLALSQQIDNQQKRAFEESDAVIAKSQALTRLARELGVPKKDVVVVYAYGVPIQCSVMLEVMNWTGAFVEEITTMCPNQHAIFDTVIVLNTAIPLANITDIDWDMVVWPGNGSNLPEYLESVGAINIPKNWHVRRSRWFFVHGPVQ